MAPPRDVPMNGKRIGKRNSWLKISLAWAPTGNPVQASRGAAWLSAKPRSDVPPPAKKRSGRGMIVGVGPEGAVPATHCPGVGAGKVSETVSRTGTSKPNRVERAKLNRRLIGWYVEFCRKNRRKLALEPNRVSASLKSALL